MKWIQRIPLLAVLALLPMESRADVGSLGGVVEFAFSVALVFWSILTLIVFLLLRRKLKLVPRILTALLFFVTPALVLALLFFKVYAFGDVPTDVVESASAPVAVAGAVFPAGSRVRYEQSGGFLGWHAQRTVLEIQTSQVVSLGHLRIYRLQTDSGNTQLQVSLINEQTIDGWPCANGDYTTVEPAPQGYALVSCWLAESHVWQGQTVPAGTYVTRNGDADWSFYSMARPEPTAMETSPH